MNYPPPYPPPPPHYIHLPQDLNHLEAHKNLTGRQKNIENFLFFLYSTYFFPQLLSKKQGNNERIGSECKNEFYSITNVLLVTLAPTLYQKARTPVFRSLHKRAPFGQLLGILRSRAPTFLGQMSFPVKSQLVALFTNRSYSGNPCFRRIFTQNRAISRCFTSCQEVQHFSQVTYVHVWQNHVAFSKIMRYSIS